MHTNQRDVEGPNVLVLDFPEGRTALPVFGLEEEAGMFLWLETAGEGWRVAEISEADLGALLRGSCASVVHPFAEEDVGPSYSAKVLKTLLWWKASGSLAARAWIALYPVQWVGTSTPGSKAARYSTVSGMIGSKAGPPR